MFIPTEFLDDTLKAALDALVEAPPPWLSAANNLLYWLALVVIEPVYVGAGFALYLNRRTQLEAWDIELAFRRLAARLAATAKATALLLLFGGALLWPAPTPAGEPLPEREDSASEALAQRLGSDFHADPAAFEAAASKAVADPLLRPKEIASGWRRRHPAADDPDAPSLSWLDGVAAFIGLVMENMLWIGLAIALIVVLRHRQWLAGWWRRDAAAAAPALPAESLREADEVLPDDLAAAVDALWRQGKARAALALFYRGALQRLDTRLPRPLPPGATEADGLRAARRLGDDPFARLFASLVAAWQAAAYADRWPLEGQLQGWLQQWRQLAGQGGP